VRDYGRKEMIYRTLMLFLFLIAWPFLLWDKWRTKKD
jgi:hypothetical protein